MNMEKRKAIFLDRDGTINKEVEYLYKPSEFSFIPGVIDAIKIFKELGYLVIVITNQSGVARGYYTEKDILVLHNYMNTELEKNISKDIKFDACYYCPHHPDGTIEKYSINCNCRKPNIGMIKQAIKEFKENGIEIDLSESYIVGDKEIDVETGKKIGLYNSILVRSGHKVDELNTVADMVYDDLNAFAHYLKEL